ncbi:MAG: PD40 domain-containing protein [Bacteroidales bacterium]|nr:MAG: PD40 domain-containing protein [Bacteroidales bacterium]
MKKITIPLFLAIILVACSDGIPDDFILSNESVKIYPDYTNLTIPFNIAPTNFTIDEDADGYITKVYSAKGKSVNVIGKDVLIKVNKWKELLLENKGDTVCFQIYLQKGNEWTKYPVIKNYIANEPIDNYISYRLIEPLFAIYDEISIHQRDITSFNQKTIYHSHLVSTGTRGQCINCHSFQDYNRNGKIQMHFRGYLGGTLITKDRKLEKYNLKTDSTISGGVYPTWHPSLDLIVYSVNKIHQNFYTRDIQKTEVQDQKSGLVLYNIRKNEVRKIIDGSYDLETFPYWAPDGKSLFFASADYIPELDYVPEDLAVNYDKIKYDLYKISFNTRTLEFGEVDTVFKASSIGKSATFPRLSPNGKYLMFTMADFGNFHIWHKTSNLYLIDMETGETRGIEELNSSETESYHSWSSNGSWVIFSSRRQDGAYTRFYISYFDGQGNFHKPFILPQKDPQFYQQFFKSFNVPEFLIRQVDFSPHDFLKALKTNSKNAVFAGNAGY